MMSTFFYRNPKKEDLDQIAWLKFAILPLTTKLYGCKQELETMDSFSSWVALIVKPVNAKKCAYALVHSIHIVCMCFFLLLLLCSQLHLGWDFCMWPLFNPTIEVVTLGMFLLQAFSCLGHKRQDLLSPCDGTHACTDYTLLCTLIWEFLGNGVRTHANSKGNVPLPKAQRTVKHFHDAASRKSPTHYRLSYSSPCVCTLCIYLSREHNHSLYI